MSEATTLIGKYRDMNFHLFPIRGKKPCLNDNLNKASIFHNQIMHWKEQFKGCNWGLSLAKSGYVCVDVDAGGLEFWQGLIEKHGEPKTLIQKSGSGVGFHYVFNARPDTKYKGKIIRGIDIKHNGYIVVEPSIHVSTKKKYFWLNKPLAKSEINDMPKWLRDLCERPKAGQPVTAPKLSSAYLNKCVETLKECELDYDEWTAAGMAIHSNSPDETGLKLFLDLTQGISFEEGDLDKAVEKWKGFDKSGGITIHTITWLLKEKNKQVPNPYLDEDIEAFTEALGDEKKVFQRAKDRHTFVCWDKDQVVNHFNKMGYASILDNESDKVVLHIKEKNGIKNVSYMSFKNFEFSTYKYKFLQNKESQAGMSVQKLLAAHVWRESDMRANYSTLVFKPDNSHKKDELNIFSRIPIDRIAGEPTISLGYLFNSLCNESDNSYEWLCDWLAHIVQKPHVKATTVPVLIGAQGTGKGLLIEHILSKMFGDLYALVTSTSQLTARFNENLAAKLITAIDESTWRGNKQEDNTLKQLTGSNKMSVEAKHGKRYQIENYSRYIIASNNEEAVAIEVGNRRYFTIQSSKKYANDLKYFAPIGHAIRQGDEVNKLYNWLLERDISKFNPYYIPKTTQGSVAKVKSEGPVCEFWADMLYENPLQIWKAGKGVDCNLAYELFQRFCDGVKSYQRGISRKAFWSQTSRFVDLPPKDRAMVSGMRTFYRNITAKQFFIEYTTRLKIVFPVDSFNVVDYEIDDLDEDI